MTKIAEVEKVRQENGSSAKYTIVSSAPTLKMTGPGFEFLLL